MSIVKRGHVKVHYPKMRQEKALRILMWLKTLRRSEVEITIYVHPDDLPTAFDAMGDANAHAE